MPKLRESIGVPQPVNQQLELPTRFPRLPQSMRARFAGDAEEYDAEMERFWTRTKRVLMEAHNDVAAPLNQTKEDVRNVRKEFVAADATLSASFDEKIDILVTADEAMASRTTTLEASVNTPTTGLLARMTTEETTRATQTAALATRATNLEASVNTAGTGLLARVTTIEGAYVTATTAQAIAESRIAAQLTGPSGTIYASVASEAAARVTADGNLSAKYTLAVAVGGPVLSGGAIVVGRPYEITGGGGSFTNVGAANNNVGTRFVATGTAPAGWGQLRQLVATGFNITSALDAGVSSSEIAFQADRFRVATATGTPIDLVSISAAGFVFGTDIASNNFAAGSAGWQLTRAGNLEVNNGTFRGILDVGAGTSRTRIDTASLVYGYGANDRMEVGYDGSALATYLRLYRAGTLRAELETFSASGQTYSYLNLTSSAGKVLYLASNLIEFDSDFNASLKRPSANKIRAEYDFEVGHNLNTIGTVTTASLLNTVSGWSVPMWDGSHWVQLRWNGTTVQARIDLSDSDIINLS